MVEPLHKDLAAGRWKEMSVSEQMGNIGSEVGRAAKWEKKGDTVQRDRALDRAFELLDLSKEANTDGSALKEICRAREVLADTFYGNREYGDTPEKLEKYFYEFALAARFASEARRARRTV